LKKGQKTRASADAEHWRSARRVLPACIHSEDRPAQIRSDHDTSQLRLTVKRLATAGLNWPLPAEMTDSALETALFAAAGTKQGHRRHAEPDWAEIHRDLKRKHVTLTMLWDEYIERCPEG
jgi:hypothetical protein